MPHEIKVNDVLVHTISDNDILALNHVIPSADVEQQIIDALVYIVKNKVVDAYSAMERDGIPLLIADGATTISFDRDTNIAAIVAATGYEDKDAQIAAQQA